VHKIKLCAKLDSSYPLEKLLNATAPAMYPGWKDSCKHSDSDHHGTMYQPKFNDEYHI